MGGSLRGAVALAAAAGVVLRAAGALACGGCVHAPAPPTSEAPQVVTEHRMVVAMHTGETVLWDQVRFAGAPREFAWIMPVRGAVTVEVGDALFMDQIAAATAPRVLAPSVTCDRAMGRTTVRPADAAAQRDDPELIDRVTVLRSAVVGPYQIAVVRGDDPAAITAWLSSNGYVITPEIEAPIAYYTALRSDFVVARLRPDQGVEAIRPLRIRLPGTVTQLPLRMVAAGVADEVGIELYLVGEGRWNVTGFAGTTVASEDLTWSFAQGASNYAQAFQRAVWRTGAPGWVTEFAGPVDRAWAAGTSAEPEWSLALQGVPGAWVSRVRTVLPRLALDAELQFGAADNVPVARAIAAQRWDDAVPRACGEGGIGDAGRDAGRDGGAADASARVVFDATSPGCACSAPARASGGGSLGACALLAACAVVARRRR